MEPPDRANPPLVPGILNEDPALWLVVRGPAKASHIACRSRLNVRYSKRNLEDHFYEYQVPCLVKHTSILFPSLDFS